VKSVLSHGPRERGLRPHLVRWTRRTQRLWGENSGLRKSAAICPEIAAVTACQDGRLVALMQRISDDLETMKALNSTTVAAFAAAVLLSSCSDPADEVHKAPASPRIETASAAPANAKAYAIAPESSIGFVGSKVTGSHEGGFREFSGSIHVADGKVTGSSVIEIQMGSTWSDNDRLTGHLKSPDFFDVAQFPTARFTVTSVKSLGDGHEVTGNLELHGVSKSISFPANIEVSDNEVAVRAEFAINRKDFDIKYPGKPDDLIRDNVVIKLEIKANPA